jgi:WD40 repeat protein
MQGASQYWFKLLFYVMSLIYVECSFILAFKGYCLQCFKGHNGPVSSLSNELLGEDSSSILASGGQDGTVRLWSLRSSSEEEDRYLKATLHGHEKPVELMSVSG